LGTLNKLLILTPLEKELDAFRRTCTHSGYQLLTEKIGRLPVTVLPELGLTVARCGSGKVQFAVQTQHLLDNSPGWDLAICAGAAGAIVEEVAVGDVVVGTRTVEHDYLNKFSIQPLPVYDAPENIVASFKALPASAGFTLHFGSIASGDEDIITHERRVLLHEATGALVAAWEGAGGARACRFSMIPFIEIRAVTDAADHNAPADFESNLTVAMGNIGRLIISWVQHGGLG
jgi:adenosylhomocysteine nucleosidase